MIAGEYPKVSPTVHLHGWTFFAWYLLLTKYKYGIVDQENWCCTRRYPELLPKKFVYEVFRRMPDRGKTWGAIAWHLSTRYFTNAIREVRRRFESVEVDRLRVKPVVKITGEFYVQTVEGAPNYNIHRWLEAEGAEVYPAAISIWIDYLLRFAGQDAEDHIGVDRYARVKLAGIRMAHGVLRWTYERMRRAMGGVPHTLPDQYELRRLAAP